MKKGSIGNRRGTIARRRLTASIVDRSSPYTVNGESYRAIRVAAVDVSSDARPAATENPANASAAVLEHLAGVLGEVTAATHPRTFKLLQSGRRKLARKVIEEACEVTVEAVKRDSGGVVRESADLLYHLIVLWFHMGIEPIEIWREMQARARLLGIAEKLPKPTGSDAAGDELGH
jgi:phosphoribosyl-ATP pyrophosphohydrolase